mmetsp:Transcript_13010/g.28000  ORF Transcript_13010/g.28000 Transcript_13010/m.28000 type:complete len:223 (-) Transcript_13010:332-1000(-)
MARSAFVLQLSFGDLDDATEHTIDLCRVGGVGHVNVHLFVGGLDADELFSDEVEGRFFASGTIKMWKRCAEVCSADLIVKQVSLCEEEDHAGLLEERAVHNGPEELNTLLHAVCVSTLIECLVELAERCAEHHRVDILERLGPFASLGALPPDVYNVELNPSVLKGELGDTRGLGSDLDYVFDGGQVVGVRQPPEVLDKAVHRVHRHSTGGLPLKPSPPGFL